MSKLETEDFRQLPNSKWLRDLIESARKDLLNIIKCERDEKVWQEEYQSYNEWDVMRKEDLEMYQDILTKCIRIKEGEPIYFTEVEWDWICGFFVGDSARYIFDTAGFTPWDIGEKPNMADAEHIKWFKWYNWYCDVVDKKEKSAGHEFRKLTINEILDIIEYNQTLSSPIRD